MKHSGHWIAGQVGKQAGKVHVGQRKQPLLYNMLYGNAI